MNSARQRTGRTAALVAPEILQGADTITREADVFAFGMILIEVSTRALSHLALEVEGWMVRLISECCLRFLQEGLRSVNLRLQSLFRRLSIAIDPLARTL